MLMTDDAHGLYSRFGFTQSDEFGKRFREKGRLPHHVAATGTDS
jgi:hypothetical protein